MNDLLNVLHFYQVRYFSYHTQDLGGCFHFFGGMCFIQTECLQGQFLTLGTIDRTFHEGNFYFLHTIRFVAQAQGYPLKTFLSPRVRVLAT